MNCNRSLLILSVLVFTTPVLGQQHNGTVGRPAPGAARPGQVHSGQRQQHHMMTPQQQMEYEFFQHQMWLMEEMAPRHSARSHAQGQSAAGQNQSGATPRSQAAQPRQAEAGSLGATPQQPNQSSVKKGKHDAAAPREAHREKELLKERMRDTKAATANRSSHAADNLAIGHLKTVHAKLRTADADDDGHRVRAMNHIETAIQHMGSTSGLNMGLGGGFGGGGRMPQAESDRILHDAIFQLRQTQSSLRTGQNTAAHHRNAHASVNEAIHQLEVALKIR